MFVENWNFSGANTSNIFCSLVLSLILSLIDLLRDTSTLTQGRKSSAGTCMIRQEALWMLHMRTAPARRRVTGSGRMWTPS